MMDCTENIKEQAYNFFMNAPVVIGLLKTKDYVIEMANDRLLEVWGRTSEVIGKPLLQAIPELEGQGFIELMDKVRTTGEPFYAYEYPITLIRDGKQEVFYFDFVYKGYYENKNTTVADGVISVGHDVTEQVLAKRKEQESETKYRSLFNSMDQGFCIIELVFDTEGNPIDYKFLEANNVFEKQTGLVDAIGKTARELIPNLEQQWFNIYGKVALTGKSSRFTERSEAMGRWFDVYAFKIGDEINPKVAVLFSDITDQKVSNEKIKESEERFQKLADESPMFVFITDPTPEASVNYWNKTWLQFTGQTNEEALGRAWDGIIHPDDIAGVMATYLPAFEKQEAYFLPAVRVRRHDGEYRWHVFKANPRFLSGDEFNGFVGVGFDIHEQKLAEEALKQSEAQLQIKVEERTKELENQKSLFNNILINSSNGISVTEMIRDENGKVIDAKTILANDSAIKNTGLTRDVFLSTTARQLDPNIMTSPYGLACLKTLKTGEPALFQYFLELTGRWLELTISKMDDEHLIHIFTDITPIKEAQLQLERTIEELKQSNSNLEEFAFAASHDLKEPVRKIRTFAGRLKPAIQENLSPQDQFYFEKMEKATERMHYLIEDLLEYSHVSTSNNITEDIDLNRKVRLVLEDIELQVAEKKAEIIVGPLPFIKGHRRQIQQVFQNLLTNALKFSKPGIAPVIKISNTVVDKKDIIGLTENLPYDQYNLVEFSDNGIGFEQQYADTIFKMFQRLHGKTEYDGTGIGLAIVKKVIENHKGLIKAESEPGYGTTFKIYLPIE